MSFGSQFLDLRDLEKGTAIAGSKDRGLCILMACSFKISKGVKRRKAKKLSC